MEDAVVQSSLASWIGSVTVTWAHGPSHFRTVTCTSAPAFILQLVTRRSSGSVVLQRSNQQLGEQLNICSLPAAAEPDRGPAGFSLSRREGRQAKAPDQSGAPARQSCFRSQLWKMVGCVKRMVVNISRLTPPKDILVETKRTIYSKPPRNKIGAAQSFLVMSVFAAAMLAPAAWILHHLPEYRQRAQQRPRT
ncbi:COX8 domain-containing protein [Cololabis saira]|uniref:COX8 domain-containing protein n=1 Tax=Cololabis saira TaxID=129043 RepID=UPI002AD2D340|nr:COX8 domain-containing protein [Cololabis saira]